LTGSQVIGPLFLGLLLLMAFGAFSRRADQLRRFVMLGKPVQRFDDIPKRIELETTVVLGQRKLLQRFLPGIMHAFIFWGFLVLLTTIVEAFGEVFRDRFAIPLIGHSPRWCSWASNWPCSSARPRSRSGSRAATWPRPTSCC